MIFSFYQWKSPLNNGACLKKEWSLNKSFLKDFNSDLSKINSAENYKILLSWNGEYNKSAELACTAVCFPIITFEDKKSHLKF